MDLFGFNVELVFLIDKNTVLAYAWHYDEKKALLHLNKIKKYHGLEGKIRKSEELEEWLRGKLEEIVIHGEEFDMPDIGYRNKRVYENIIRIPRGETSTYAKIARKSEVKFTELLVALMRNPFQILIPCHRLLTNKGTLLGFYPLGREVKKKLLEIEGAKW